MIASRLETSLCGIKLRNPILAASGTFGYGIEFASLLDLNQLGGVITKGLSIEPIAGNPAPRLWHTESGMINSVGLQNVGVRAFVAKKLPQLRRYSVPVFANVFGYSATEYVDVVRILEEAEGISGYELNVSCPNTKHGGIFFSNDPSSLADLVRQVRRVASRPLVVKLSPSAANILSIAAAAEESGADVLSLVNTFLSLDLDASSRASRIGAGFGGLSGSAIRPIALRLVQEVSNASKIPVIGLGGIMTGENAAEFLIAGARAVQVGTATFVDPTSPIRIARELDEILSRLGIGSPGEIVGTFRKPGA